MPGDYITLNALTSELSQKLTGGKIRRICQPEKDEITVSVFNGRTNLLLVISANPNSPRIHLTTTKKENPYAAPPLLMILRKYIGSAVIRGMKCISNDRIVEITLNARNEMFDDEDFYLVCELMGRYSNIILLDGERRILDSLYKLVPDEKQRRQILIGARYEPPEQNKVFIGDEESLRAALAATDRPYKDFLSKEAAGTSSVSAAEIIRTAEALFGAATPDSVAAVAKRFANLFADPLFSPCVDSADRPDFYPYARSDIETTPRDSLNECADEVYSLADRESRLRAASKTLERALSQAIKKTKNSIDIISAKLADESRAEDIRITAELITSNLYKVKPRETELEVYDYYANETRRIALDPTMSANQYAQKLYKKYAKLKRGKEINEALLEQNQANLLYLEDLSTQLKMAETQDDILITEEEMSAAGLIRVQRKKHEKKSLPTYLTFEKDGYKILCGKGGIQNEYITFKVAKEHDIWLHVAKSHGSHVVIVTNKDAVPERVILFAAEIAAYYSDRRTDVSVPVDYTFRRNVRRHPAKKVGLVYYSDYKTIDVKPDAHLPEKI